MPNIVNTPIYLDWSFWAVIIAMLALVLSQLPPVHLLFKRAKLDMELYSRIILSHKIGNPNLQFHLILSNTGGRVIKVRGITTTIRRDSSQIAVLPAQTYFLNPTDTTPLLFTRFSLKPRDEWAHFVSFLNFFSRSDEKKYRDAEAKLKTDILKKIEEPQNKDKLVEADNKLVTVFWEMFDEKFLWLPGEYEICISVDTEPTRVCVEKKYRFTLFESNSEELSKFREDYKFGDGIYFQSGKHSGVVVQISEA